MSVFKADVLEAGKIGKCKNEFLLKNNIFKKINNALSMCSDLCLAICDSPVVLSVVF